MGYEFRTKWSAICVQCKNFDYVIECKLGVKMIVGKFKVSIR